MPGGHATCAKTLLQQCNDVLTSLFKLSWHGEEDEMRRDEMRGEVCHETRWGEVCVRESPEVSIYN